MTSLSDHIGNPGRQTSTERLAHIDAIRDGIEAAPSSVTVDQKLQKDVAEKESKALIGFLVDDLVTAESVD